MVEALRNDLPGLLPSLHWKDIDRLPRICPGLAVRPKRQGEQKTDYTGIVLLEVADIQDNTDIEDIKRRAAQWPMTMAALTGASGRSVKILVRGTLSGGKLPLETADIERFHTALYDECARVYSIALGRTLKKKDAKPTDWFRWTLDDTPFIHLDASPLCIDSSVLLARNAEGATAAQEYGPESTKASLESRAYYRRRLSLALQTVGEMSPRPEHGTVEELNAVAREALRLDMPQEETVYQAISSLYWRGLSREFIRTTIECVYAENTVQRGRNHSHPLQELTTRLQAFMQARYDLRYNELTNGVEWRSNHSSSFTFQPLDIRTMNTMIQEAHEAGLEVFDRDMKRYLSSTRIRNYNAALAYLDSVRGQWDHKTDYIGMLADRVPCHNPFWRKWFHTWFLGMVAQWQGQDVTHGNSVVPLLIGQQGCGKSTFGQLLLPPELRSVGYRELVDFSSKQEVERQLATSLLINLDEFNQISPKIQQGFLKNLIQKSTVKSRRPYSSETIEMPRYASFIATSNMNDVLSDPTGSRRFIVADIRDGEMVNNRAPYYLDQVYAQAMDELEKQKRHYFTPAEVADIEAYNARYTQLRPEVEHFLEVFEPVTAADDDTERLRLSDIIQTIHKRTRYKYSNSSAQYLGRWLTSESRLGRMKKQMSKGHPFYLVRIREE